MFNQFAREYDHWFVENSFAYLSEVEAIRRFIPDTGLGVEIGAGFESTRMHGSQNNDEMYVSKGKVKFRTNNAGGISGGISNGDDIVCRMAVKPASSIAKEQKTVNTKGKSAKIAVQGRHDPCLCPRAVPVAGAMVAIVLMDMYLIARTRKK